MCIGREQHWGVQGTAGQDPAWDSAPGEQKLSRLAEAGRGPHHRVLRQVVVGPPGDGVELHQVLKVGNLPLGPFLGSKGRWEVSQWLFSTPDFRAPASPRFSPG